MRNLCAFALILLAGMALSSTASAATGPVVNADVEVSFVVSNVPAHQAPALACSAAPASASLVGVAPFRGEMVEDMMVPPRCFLTIVDTLPDGTIITVTKEVPCPE